MEKCTQGQRLNAIEEDIKELKESAKYHSTEITALKESHAETKVYVKQILSRIDDLKVLFTSATNAIKSAKESESSNSESLWAKHSGDLVKLVVFALCVAFGVKYFTL